jgi:hypothetical protein
MYRRSRVRFAVHGVEALDVPRRELDIKSTSTCTMSAHDKRSTRMELSELIACTLTDANLKTQRERWLALGESFGLGRTETQDGLRLRFRGDPAIEAELEALVAVENDCCSWAAWTVEHDDDALVMAARSRGDGIATLHGMFRPPEFVGRG